MSKGEIKPGGVRYHTGRRIMMLKNVDHGLIFRVQKDGTIVVELNIGKNKKTNTITNGGVILSTIATNIFTQEFMDLINNQIQGLSKVSGK